MTFLLTIVEFMIYALASWTLAYHAVLLARLPAIATLIPFIVILGLLARWRWSSWKHSVNHLRRPADRHLLLAVLTIGLVMGTLTLIVSRPDDDDVGFFHRALVQGLTQPFTITDTMHNMQGLSPLSVLHVATSYEPLFTFLGRIPGIDALSAHQNASAFVAVMLMTAGYVLLNRNLRLSRRSAVIATLCAFAFLLYDGGVHRSFGNMAFVRLWQGKTILWSVFIPLTLLISLRYLRRPTIERLIPVFMLGVCAVGLSNAGVFQIPVLVGGIGATFLLIYGFRYWQRVLVLVFAGTLYCDIPALLLVLDIAPKPTFVIQFEPSMTWIENLNEVIGGGTALVRNLFILLLLPLAGLSRLQGRFLLVLSLVFIAIFANPLTGPIWFAKIIHSSAYWRMAYLFPLPLCAGLIGAALLRRGIGRRAVASLAILVLAFTFQRASVNQQSSFKPIWEYRFTPNELAFSRLIAPHVWGENLLVTDAIATPLQLLVPSIHYEAGRTMYTRQIFRDSNLPEERARRLAAQAFLETCTPTPEGEHGFLVALENGSDGIVMRDCGVEFNNFVIVLAYTVDTRLIVAENAYGYVWLDRVD